MKGLDTNVLVRFLTADDPRQSEIARAVVEAAEDKGDPLFVSSVVLCELVWVLRGGRYKYSKSEIVDVLTGLLETSVFELQDRSLVRDAIHRYSDGAADFADYLIGLIHDSAGCEVTWTFETKLVGAAGFDVLG